MDSPVRSVIRALDLITATAGGRSTLTELSAETNMSLSTTSRLLSTLRVGDFVEQREDGTYRPGRQLLQILYAIDGSSQARARVRVAVERLRDEVDETAAFFVMAGRERMCVETAESTRLTRQVCPLGLRAPFYLGAASKLLLALSNTDRLLRWIPLSDGNFVLATGETRTLGDLRAECDKIREQGYAVSRQESTLESWGVAAPIYHDGVLAGALTVLVPMTRHDPAYCDHLAEACVKVAGEATKATTQATDDETL